LRSVGFSFGSIQKWHLTMRRRTQSERRREGRALMVAALTISVLVVLIILVATP
jgi:hypothetical protein